MMTWQDIRDRALAAFPLEKWTKMEQAAKEFNGYGFEKYFDYKTSLDYASQCAAICNADRGGLEVFDIGTGSGFFPYICKLLDNNIYTCDALSFKGWVLDQQRQSLGVLWCRDYTLNRCLAPQDCHTGEFSHKPIPFPHANLDIISAFAVAPHSMFTRSSWLDLIQDCARVMKEGGTLYLNPNESPGLVSLRELRNCGELDKYNSFNINILVDKR